MTHDPCGKTFSLELILIKICHFNLLSIAKNRHWQVMVNRSIENFSKINNQVTIMSYGSCQMIWMSICDKFSLSSRGDFKNTDIGDKS